jgi:ketosteroid isomerase-like protein
MSDAACSTVRELIRRMAEGPSLAAADLFSTDAVFEMPFAPPGAPAQEPGRDAFRAHLQEGAGLMRFEAADDVEVREMADPGLVLAEYRMSGRVLATGREFCYRVATLSRVEDGLITWSRTYTSPLDLAIALDAVDGLAATLRP